LDKVVSEHGDNFNNFMHNFILGKNIIFCF
jgi:hypothetical protein